MDIKGLAGQRYQLESKPFSSGGEGDVYGIVGSSSKVVKVYHQGLVTTELEEKLKIMVRRPPNSSILSQVAWPLDLVYDSYGYFCGFVMPRLSINAELNDIYGYPPRTNITYKQKLIIAQNICAVISEIHNAGYVLGDLNPINIGINMPTGTVAFLDTDSYHVSDENRVFRCNACLDGYVAPELIKQCESSGRDYANAPLPTFTEETDSFALAIHIFKLLMNGYTPFNGIKETQSATTASPGVGNQAIKRDSYCFKPGNKPMSPAVPPIETLPTEIADLFTRAFMDGRIDPKQRPSAYEWYKALENYEQSLVVCKKNSTHMYKRGLKRCPWCDADKAYKTMIGEGGQESTASCSNELKISADVQTHSNPAESIIDPIPSGSLPGIHSVPVTVKTSSGEYKIGEEPFTFYKCQLSACMPEQALTPCITIMDMFSLFNERIKLKNIAYDTLLVSYCIPSGSRRQLVVPKSNNDEFNIEEIEGKLKLHASPRFHFEGEAHSLVNAQNCELIQAGEASDYADYRIIDVDGLPGLPKKGINSILPTTDLWREGLDKPFKDGFDSHITLKYTQGESFTLGIDDKVYYNDELIIEVIGRQESIDSWM